MTNKPKEDILHKVWFLDYNVMKRCEWLSSKAIQSVNSSNELYPGI